MNEKALFALLAPSQEVKRQSIHTTYLSKCNPISSLDNNLNVKSMKEREPLPYETGKQGQKHLTFPEVFWAGEGGSSSKESFEILFRLSFFP